MKEYNTIIKRKYDTTAVTYDEQYGMEQGLKYLATWKKLNEFHGLLLDAGCGTLLFEEFLKTSGLIEKISYIIGLDISTGMLEIGMRKLINGELPSHKIDLVLADITYLPFRKKSIDNLVSYTVLTLLDDPKKGLIELKRVAKKHVLISILKRFSYRVLFYDWEKISETEKDSIFLIRISEN